MRGKLAIILLIVFFASSLTAQELTGTLQQIAVKRADIFYQLVDIPSAGPGFGFGVKPVLLVQVMFKFQVFIADLGCDIERFIIQVIKVLIKVSLILINSL